MHAAVVMPEAKPTQASEQELVRRSQAGDKPAYGELVRRHQVLVFAVVSRLVTPRGLGPDVEDIAQEAFLRAYRGLQGFDPAGVARFRTWLLRVATNLSLDRLKAAGRRQPSTSLLALVPDASLAPDSQHERERLGQSIQQAVAKLADAQRAVFILREIHGLPFEEIAEIVGVTASGARVRMFRAKQTLCQELAQQREDLDD